MLNIENEFRQPLSMDEAPEGSVCECVENPPSIGSHCWVGKTTTKVDFFAVPVVKHSFAPLQALFVAK